MDKRSIKKQVISLLHANEPPRMLERAELDYAPYDLHSCFYRSYQQFYDLLVQMQKHLLQNRVKTQMNFNSSVASDAALKKELSKQLENEAQINFKFLRLMEEFSISLIENIFKKVDVTQIRFQQLQFPFELQEELLQWKSDHLYEDSALEFESDDNNTGPARLSR